MIDALQRFLEAGHSELFECMALFLLPFAHEDVAILGGSLLVVEHQLPVGLALLSLYGGIVTSDFAIYGLGALMRRSPRIRRMLLSPRIDRLGHWLGSHTPEIVMMARLLPGLMFPLYLTCGLYRVSLLQFGLTTVLSAAIYLPIVFLLFSTFGAAVLSDLGYWAWILAIVIFAVAVFNWMRSPKWQFLLRVSSTGAGALVSRGDAVALLPDQVTHRGMPAVGDMPRKVALAERIPPLIFYIPLAVQWVWLGLKYRDLSLPALANPMVEVGGLWGESKSSYMVMLSMPQRGWLADFVTIRREQVGGSDCERASRAMASAGLSFPVVAKPDIGWRGYGVALIQNAAELRAYLAAFPLGEVIILQRPIFCDGEAGVLYVRMPGEAGGKILSLTFRYFPFVVGDGHSPLRDLILRDARTAWKAGAHFGLDTSHIGRDLQDLDRVPAAGETVRLSFIGSNRVGGLYRDAREHITAALTRRFDEISKGLPEFYYGRYDIRFESVEQLRNGEGFSIIEINGAGGESINVWDPAMPLAQVYRELFQQQRLLFEIGDRNRRRGFRPPGARAIVATQWHQYRLIVHYPPSA
jgi:membrane protein DedA with SNARE-associated domain